jgi:hypothetical protein
MASDELLPPESGPGPVTFGKRPARKMRIPRLLLAAAKYHRKNSSNKRSKSKYLDAT